MEDTNFLSEIVAELNSNAPNLQNANNGETIIKEEAVQAPEPVIEPEPKAQPELVAEEADSQVDESPQWYDSDDSVAKEDTKVEAKETPKEEKIEEDPDIELIKKYKKSGKSLRDFVNDYKVEDFSSMSEKDLVKKGLEEFYQLSGEELDNAIYEFENSSIFNKKQLVEGFRNRFDQQNEAKLKELTSGYEINEKEEQMAIEQLNQSMEGYRQKIVDQEIYGMKVTDEMSKDLSNYLSKEFTLQKEDGTLDIEKAYSVALWLKYGKELVKANITKAKNQGKEQVIKEVSNPSKNKTFGGRAVGSGIEAAQEAFNQLFLNNK